MMGDGMNILVTGATGFIGRHLTASLTVAGHDVYGLTRDPERAHATMPGVSAFFAWQLEQSPPREAIDRADAVIHLAGETVAGRWTAAKKQRIRDSRVVGTRSLVQALAAAGRGQPLVCASAVGYYGDRGDEQLTESSPPGAGFLAEVTQAWEREALQAGQSGAHAAVMRFGLVLGREGGALKPLLPLFRWGLGGALGNGRQWWPWVHIDDVVAALQQAAAGAWQGAFNVTAPEPLRQRDFARALGAALHRPALVPVPALALRLTQGEFADELLFSRRVLPARLQQSSFHFSYPEIGAALRQLVGEGE
jgi:uncharacterized protein (TIGR01777 family)